LHAAKRHFQNWYFFLYFFSSNGKLMQTRSSDISTESPRWPEVMPSEELQGVV